MAATHVLRLREIDLTKRERTPRASVMANHPDIRADAKYFARIYGHWFFGGFSRQWYGWNFRNWGTSGIQLDSIELVFEVLGEPEPQEG